MRKQITIIAFLIVLLLSSATALKECKEVMKPQEIPCEIITTWDYENPCNTYTMKVYNQTPTFIYSTTLTDYTGTGRCNTTFNHTVKGSYIFNISNGGDSGRIIVEVKMESAIAIILTGFGALFMLVGIVVILKRMQHG